MKKIFLSIYILLAFLICLWTARCVVELTKEKRVFYEAEPVAAVSEAVSETETVPADPAPETTVPRTTQAPSTVPTEAVTEPPAETTAPVLLTFTEEEEELLLKLGMAERGDTWCTECIALVMRTVLNRVESPKFSSTIKGVIYAQDQFTPVMDGSFDSAQPNIPCYDALEMIKEGWDESQGALYYEWSEGESWHSRNLNLLFQHCDTRFYN